MYFIDLKLNLIKIKLNYSMFQINLRFFNPNFKFNYIYVRIWKRSIRHLQSTSTRNKYRFLVPATYSRIRSHANSMAVAVLTPKFPRLRLLGREISWWEIADSLSSQRIFKWERGCNLVDLTASEIKGCSSQREDTAITPALVYINGRGILVIAITAIKVHNQS